MEFDQTQVRQRSESDDEIARADSISRKIDEMNKFEEGDLGVKDSDN
jgi:hypothetical protein